MHSHLSGDGIVRCEKMLYVNEFQDFETFGAFKDLAIDFQAY